MKLYEKFKKRKFIFLFWFLIVGLFADQANISDFVEDTDIVHSDEPNVSEQSSFLLLHYRNHNTESNDHKVSNNAKYHLKKIFFDQDSPSLKAVSLGTALTFFYFIKDKKVSFSDFRIGSLLYLIFCSLLI